MTDDLYRKEALQHRHRSLYGEVVLSAPPATWWITGILVAVLIVITAMLMGIQVKTDTDSQPLWQWLWARIS